MFGGGFGRRWEVLGEGERCWEREGGIGNRREVLGIGGRCWEKEGRGVGSM